MKVSFKKFFAICMILAMAAAFMPGSGLAEAGDAYADSTDLTTFYASNLAGNGTDSLDISGDLELIMDKDISLDHINATGNITITNSGTRHKLTMNAESSRIKADSDETVDGELNIDGIELNVDNTDSTVLYGTNVELNNTKAYLKSFDAASLIYGRNVTIKNSELRLQHFADDYSLAAIHAWKGNVLIEDTELHIENPEGSTQRRPLEGISASGEGSAMFSVRLKNVKGSIKTSQSCIFGYIVILERCDLDLDSSKSKGISSGVGVDIKDSTLVIDSYSKSIEYGDGDLTIGGSDLKLTCTNAHAIGGFDNQSYGSVNISDSYLDITALSDDHYPVVTIEGTITLSEDLYIRFVGGKTGIIWTGTDINGVTFSTITDEDGCSYYNTVIARINKPDPIFEEDAVGEEGNDTQTDDPVTTYPTTDPDPQEDPQTDEQPVNTEPANDQDPQTEPSTDQNDPVSPQPKDKGDTTVPVTEDKTDITPDDSQNPVVVDEPTKDTSSGNNQETITRVSISKASFKLKYNKTSYSGKAKRPAVKVTYKGKTLKKGTDYTVKYSNNIKVGKATVKVVGKGKFKGTKKLSFKINPKATKITKLLKAKKGFTVKWNKVTKQNQGYKIQYSLKKNMKGAKTVTVSSAKKASKKITKLKAKKTYYVRIRTYKKVKGVTYSSKWSAVKKVKTK